MVRLFCNDLFHIQFCFLYTSTLTISTVSALHNSLTCSGQENTIACPDNKILVKDIMLGFTEQKDSCPSTLPETNCLVQLKQHRIHDGRAIYENFINNCKNNSTCTFQAPRSTTKNAKCGRDEAINRTNDYALILYQCDTGKYKTPFSIYIYIYM